MGLHSSGAAKQGGIGAAQQGGCTAGGGAQQWGCIAASSNSAYLNLQVVIISAIVALPQVLVEHHTVHRLPWTLHIAAHNQIES